MEEKLPRVISVDQGYRHLVAWDRFHRHHLCVRASPRTSFRLRFPRSSLVTPTKASSLDLSPLDQLDQLPRHMARAHGSWNGKWTVYPYVRVKSDAPSTSYLCLVEYSLIVVVPQSAWKFVVVHMGLAFSSAPQSGHFIWILDHKFPVLALKMQKSFF